MLLEARSEALLSSAPARFDVICAGEALALWQGEATSASTPLALRPGGGAVHAALALARLGGVRVALATILPDDRVGRALRKRIADAGVDVRAVALSPPRRSIVIATSTGASS